MKRSQVLEAIKRNGVTLEGYMHIPIPSSVAEQIVDSIGHKWDPESSQPLDRLCLVSTGPGEAQIRVAQPAGPSRLLTSEEAYVIVHLCNIRLPKLRAEMAKLHPLIPGTIDLFFDILDGKE